MVKLRNSNPLADRSMRTLSISILGKKSGEREREREAKRESRGSRLGCQAACFSLALLGKGRAFSEVTPRRLL
jgi:hypothetical protein